MAHKVKVDLGERSYTIDIDSDLVKRTGVFCKELDLSGRCLMVTDSNVNEIYGSACQDSLEASGFEVVRSVVPAGESSKSEEQLFSLYDDMLDKGFDRSAFVVALGGGVVGDLAGYLAASYLRGIRFVQVPTSLLAMVDSSVGGKTGINLPQGKNLIGAFHQPEAVIADIDTLKSLAKREYLSGFAEVIKYGVIRDAELFATLESNADALVAGERDVLEPIIARCCELKAEVVHLDEREGGLRAILNFGHTLGHAIENVSGYGTYLHGEAVAIGMVYAAKLSVLHQGLAQEDAARIEELVKDLQLPTKAEGLEWSALRAAMTLDKKTAGRVPRFVLARNIGTVDAKCEVDDEKLLRVWQALS